MILLILSYYLRHFKANFSIVANDDVIAANRDLITQFVTSFPGLASVGDISEILVHFGVVLKDLVYEDSLGKPLTISSITPLVSQIFLPQYSRVLLSSSRKVQFFSACFSSLVRHSALMTTSEESIAEAIKSLDKQILVVHV